MSWKKFFSEVPVAGASDGTYSAMGGGVTGKPGPARSNYSSYLPDVYSGAPNRIERYGQYNVMDMDSEVNAALDILAEFCTQNNTQNNTPFKFTYNQKATNTEVQIIEQYLHQWCKLNDLNKRIFKIMRNVFKYGDSFFIRDPETKKLFHVDPAKVSKIIVNESTGKTPEQYVVRDINFNFRNLVATTPYQTTGNVTGGGSGYLTGGVRGMVGANYQDSPGTRFATGQREIAVDAKHIFHLSLSEGLDLNFPFGNSLLESVFKVYKQKELLEDAIIIYRVQRAPERRVFYIDVGNMPSHLAMQFVERVKTEIHQRRIPSSTGGGTNVIDSSYNPLSINEDYFFPQTAEGRGSKVETLPGGTNLGEIDDLKYFTNKLLRGLRIPSSYLPTGADDGQSQYNDGRVGTAYIQELRFNKYCERLQNMVSNEFNQEFKQYLIEKGVNIDIAMFDIKFNPPMNFASYRQAEVDNNRISTYTQIAQVPFVSKRYALSRFLGLTPEEMAENERLWREENDATTQAKPTTSATELRSAGVSTAGIQADLDAAEPEAPATEPGDEGAGTPGAGTPPDAGTTTPGT
mgnify:FL=1|tara:strand:- start:1112 stop:2836 length:1725 start_codon:yes stop_codon:yes gene_type:complete